MLSDVIPFGEWLPDSPAYRNDGVIVAENVLTHGKYYKPFKGLSESTSALAALCQGVKSFLNTDSTVKTFAGTASALYLLSGTSWSDVKLTGGYNTASEGFWQFVPYGNSIIATNYADTMQIYTIGSSMTFADLSATAPQARVVGVINDFVIAGDVVDGDGANGNRVRWSPRDAPTGVWGSSQTTQADFQDLPAEGGSVTGIVGTQNYGIVMREKSIYRMEYVGTPLIFDIQVVERDRGCRLPRTICGYGQDIYYLAEDGFYVFSGTMSIPIGDKRVDDYFLEDLNTVYSYRINAAIDPIRKLYVVAYPSNASATGDPDKLLIYNIEDKRWTYAVVGTRVLASLYSEGLTLDQLDTLYPSIDDIPFSFDSAVYKGGAAAFGAFDLSNMLGFFEGENLTAKITTQEARLNTAGRAYIKGALPVVDGGTITGRVGYRELLSGAVSYTTSQAQNAQTGEMNFDISSRYARCEVTITGNWTRAEGVQFDAVSAGKL